jgi:class 3 adenylate cyclase
MTSSPATSYARSADGTALAYQVTGDGPFDLAVLLGHAVPTDLMWDDPGLVRIRRRLGAFCRTIWVEPRGLGASDGDAADGMAGPIFEADLTAIIDAVGSGRVALLGASFWGHLAVYFAAARPDRVSSLVLVNTFAHYVREDGYPIGLPAEVLASFVARITRDDALREDVGRVAPSRVNDERFRAWWSRGLRLTAGPRQYGEAVRAEYQSDVRPLLASLRVPTLVLHRQADQAVRAEAGRYLADHIPGARFVALAGADNLIFAGDTDQLVDEVEEFLTGRRQAPEGDVALAVVLFTDIVKSTAQAARVGPRAWSRLTDDHDLLVRAALRRHGGHEVKTMGDGFLATFDGCARAMRCAAEIASSAKGIGLGVRAGLHAGDVEVRGDDVAGLTVVMAKRICDLAGAGEVLVSETIRGLVVGSGLVFSDRRAHELKGVSGTWGLFALEG